MSEPINIKPPIKVMEWVGLEGGYLRLLDQTQLPGDTTYLDCRQLATLWDAIKRLVVRGAPAIGVAAAYGMVLAAQDIPDCPPEEFFSQLESRGRYLESSRPTAVNLAWAIRRMLERARWQLAEGMSSASVRPALLEEAAAIQTEDERMCLEIGHHAAGLLGETGQLSGVLTHCNAGALATAGIGTATAGIYVAHAMGRRFTVYCDETRPLLQGSRLTAWELMQAGIDTILITDSMAAGVMRQGKVQAVLVGADRIAANGDVANKIGTYGVAIHAHRHGIPFYVAAPYSTFDLTIASGADIPIEERSSQEITEGFGRRTAPLGVRTFCPAFDVTPAELVTAIITERGVIRPVNEPGIRKLMEV